MRVFVLWFNAGHSHLNATLYSVRIGRNLSPFPLEKFHVWTEAQESTVETKIEFVHK